MEDITLFDKKNYNKIIWPKSLWGNKVATYFQPLLNQDVQKSIYNVKTDLRFLQADNLILPIAINEKEYTNSYVVSNYYSIHLIKEKLAQTKPALVPFISPFLYPLGGLLRFLQINKVVNLNAWFFSASIPPRVTFSDMENITRFLVKGFPDHLLMFRSVTTYFDSSLYNILSKLGFLLIPVREIFFYNPHTKNELPKKANYHRRRDSRLLANSGYEVVRNEDFTKDDVIRILELYKHVYIDKYTPYSPRFSHQFIKHLLDHNLLHILALKKHGKIDAMIGYQRDEKMMQVPFIGYDTTLPQEIGLYRMVSLLGYLESDKHGLYYHDGNGAEVFKMARGLEKTTEYTAIYARHFRKLRRLPWRVAEKIAKIIF